LILEDFHEGFCGVELGPLFRFLALPCPRLAVKVVQAEPAILVLLNGLALESKVNELALVGRRRLMDTFHGWSPYDR
jgi:hypothetical protein